MTSTPPDADPGLAPGRVIDRYVVEAPIGSGGMAVVYRVRHVKLGGTYALKVLTTTARSIRARLLTEGRAQSALQHPNVVAVHDVVEVDGAPCLVMDHVDGPTLAELLEQGPLTVEQADRIGRDVLRGVAAAHRHGFVHRDLKPANVLMAIGEDGLVARVSDFGLAKVVDEDAGPGATRSGATMGTPAYMAPEQIRDASRVDERADVFALGAVLYELVTGRRTFGGVDTLDLFGRIASGTYTPVREIRADAPERMVQAIEGALRVEPDDRWPSVDALLRAWAGDSASVGDSAAWDADAVARARALRAKRDGAARTSSSTFDIAAMPAPSTVAPPRTRWLVWGGAAVALAAAGLGWWSRPAAPLSFVPTVERLTRESGFQLEPALSPDGKQVVYTDTTDLWLRRTGGGGGAVNLTEAFEPHARQPAWSPDGEQLAFTGDGALYVMGALGENPRELVDLGFMPTWSPDGRQIAFCTEDVWDLRTRTSYQSTLRVVDVVTGEVRDVLTSLDPVEPAWSPSGEWIAFSGGFGLGLVRADGRDVQVGDKTFFQPAWAPDGRSIWGLRDRGDATEVVRMAVDPRTGERGEPSLAFPIAIGLVRTLSISADGRRLAVDTVDRSAHILAVPIDPVTGEVQGPPRQVTTGNDAFTSPTVSPDGQWLAYTSESFHEDLYVGRVDGSEVRQLTTGETYTRGPAWSPDGQTLAFYGRRDGKLGIWTMSVDGGNLRYLGGFGSLAHEPWLPLWSPDGARLAISLENHQPLVLSLDRPWDAQLTLEHPENDGWIATSWSPDGRWIAVSTGAGRIGRMNADTLAIEPLFDDGYYPTWMADSRHLLVAVDDRVFVLDAETREAHDVLSLAPAQVPHTPSLGLSPDGATLFVAASAADGDVWIIDLAVSP